MQLVLLLSFGLHAVAVAWLLMVRRPAPAEPDQRARIEVVFGTSGDAAPAPASAAMSAAAPARAADPRPVLDAAEVGPAAALVPAAPATPAAPDPGLHVDRPDPQMIPARDAFGNHAPDYPEAARRRHQEGTVLLRLHIGVDGAVVRIELLQSSGVPALDEAARTALAQWRFLPAEVAGRPVPSYRDQPVSFVL